ncbi:MAG: DUF3488 and transglutaminase-like domain-containing protein, partial [Burkholderiales bacterium]
FANLAALPRDSRDTLFLLAVVAWLMLPQIRNLPLWCSALAAGVLLWRGWLALKSRPLPSKWWLLALLAAAVVATIATHRTILGRDAGVTLIVVLLALKTLELRARRDALVVFFLGFFTMLTNFFFSQSLLTAAAMLIGLLGLLTALVNAHMPVGKPPLMHAAKMAGAMALLGAPIMLVLFLLFPRLAPLWGIPADAMSGRTGLSNSMQIGNIAKLALDDRIALRIKFDGDAPPQRDLYFRGPVLGRFDGREWRPLAGRDAPIDIKLLGAPVRYEVTLEPSNRPWLMLLEVTADAPKLAGLEAAPTTDLQWLASRPITDITRYRAESYTEFRYGQQANAADLRPFVDLPAGYNPRTLQWAAELRADPRFARGGAGALVTAALDRLSTGGYGYTLEPGVYGQHSADEFWFDRKQGFCEHIASAFVVLMRALDIPARIVTGYQGAELNPVDGFWVVRNSDAHAWAEVWIAGQGWLRVDPTASIAPDRIAGFSTLRAPQGAMAGMIGAVSPNLAAQLRAAWEAMNNGWNQWVLNYTQSRQLDLLKHLGFTAPSWQDLGMVLIAVLVLAALTAALWTLWDRQQHDPWLRLLARARKRLLEAGIDPAPAAPPREIAQLVRREMGGRWTGGAGAIADWLLRLEAQRYAPESGTSLAKLKNEFHRLRWPAKGSGRMRE